MVAWDASISPLIAIAQSPNQVERDQLINQWKTLILHQLQNVELIVSSKSNYVLGLDTKKSREP